MSDLSVPQQIRLEALSLSVKIHAGGARTSQVLAVAAEFTDFVTEGATVVGTPPVTRPDERQ